MINKRNNRRKFSMRNVMMAATAFALGVSYTNYPQNNVPATDLHSVTSSPDFSDNNQDDDKNKNNYKNK